MKKNKTLFILAWVFIGVTLVDLIITGVHTVSVGGVAIGGSAGGGNYLIETPDGGMQSTDAVNWYINYVLFISCFVFGILAFIGFAYIQIAYMYPEILKIKKRLEGERLL